jgi:hypothetical protein
VTTPTSGDLSTTAAIDRAVDAVAFALSTIPDFRVVTSVAMPVSPPALVIGPPRITVRGYTFAGSGVTTVGMNIYTVAAMNQYAIDVLRPVVVQVMYALEFYTEGVVINTVPGVYPSPVGALPAFITTYQTELH